MLPMDACNFVAHALRDYLRSFVPESDLKYIDSPLNCGEPWASIEISLNVALEYDVPFPELYIRRIFELEPLKDSEREYLTELVEQLPQYPAVA